MYTTLKSDFATLKSSEGLAALSTGEQDIHAK